MVNGNRNRIRLHGGDSYYHPGCGGGFGTRFIHGNKRFMKNVTYEQILLAIHAGEVSVISKGYRHAQGTESLLQAETGLELELGHR